MPQPTADQGQWPKPHHRCLTLLARTHLHARNPAKLGCTDIVRQTLMDAFVRCDQICGSTDAELTAWLRQILLNNQADARRE